MHKKTEKGPRCSPIELVRDLPTAVLGRLPHNPPSLIFTSPATGEVALRVSREGIMGRIPELLEAEVKRSQVWSSSRADAEKAPPPPAWVRGRPFLLVVLPDWFLLPSLTPAVPSQLWGQILSIPRLAVWVEEDPSQNKERGLCGS